MPHVPSINLSQETPTLCFHCHFFHFFPPLLLTFNLCFRSLAGEHAAVLMDWRQKYFNTDKKIPLI